ncbi:MAG: GntR family transcriptional regulator [Rhodoferax sp.]|uniref:GntR family transcriptional regulator n=1 Tax=Rhodoferax sp. TaxID=50421 RepID=UPI003265268F
MASRATPASAKTTAHTPSQKAEVAYQAVRRAIIEQALAPATKLPEDQLCTQFGVSRTLIRGVLSRLAAEGLVDIGNKRTATVAQPTREEARAVFEVRRCLEAEAVNLVVARWQPAMGAALEGHVREEEQAARAGRLPASARLAGEFHTLLAQMSGNPLLERYLAEVVTRCSLILAVHGRPHVSDCACTEHHGLIAALRQRDAPQAVRLMGEHLSSIERRAMLTDEGGSSDDLSSVLSRYAGEVGAPTAAIPLETAGKAPVKAPAKTSPKSTRPPPAPLAQRKGPAAR